MLKKLVLRNYKKFDDKEVQFAPGVNVIVGKNEAGKSSIMSALLTVFFSDATTKAKNFYDFVTSWQNQSKDIFLEVSLVKEGQEYLLGRDFAQGKQWFSQVGSNKAIDDYKSIANELAGKFQIPLQEVFEATSFIRQSEISNIRFSRDLRTSLQRVSAVSPEGADLENSIKDLEKELQQLQLGINRPSKNPGPIKATGDEISQQKNQLVELNQAWDKQVQIKAQGDQSDDKLKGLEEKISELETLFANYRKQEDGMKQLKSLDEQLNDVTALVTQVKSESISMKQIESQIESMGKFVDGDLEKAASDLLQLKQTIKINSETLSELKEALTKVDKGEKLNYLQQTRKKEVARQYFELGMGALAGSAIAFGLEYVTNIIYIHLVTGIGLVTGAVFFTIAFMKILAPATTGPANADEASKSDALKNQITSLETKVEQAKKHQQQIITQFGVDDVSEFFSKKANYNTLIQEFQRIETTIAGNLGGKQLKDVEAKQVDLLAQKKELETNVLTEEVKASKLTPNEYLRKRRELDMLLIEQKRLQKDSTRSEVLTEESSVSREEIVKAEEKLELLQSRLDVLDHRQNILEITIEMLKEVIKSTGKSAGKLVSQEVEKHLPKLTMNRYKDLRLVNDYDIEVFSSEKNDWVKPLSHLSLGTVDQIYLLARIALAKTLLGGRLNYLFLDDPFVTFDSERLDQMKEILTELGQSSQIFLFTHNQNYKDWGNVIEL